MTAESTTRIDDCFAQASRALKGGATGAGYLNLLPRLLTYHDHRAHVGEGYTELHTFGVCTSTPFRDFRRESSSIVVDSDGERACSHPQGSRWR